MSLQRLRRPQWSRPLAAIAMASIVAAAVGLAAVVNDALDLRPGPNEFNVPAWEVRNFANKWLYLTGGLFRSHRTTDQEDADLQRFFAAVGDVDRFEREPASVANQRLPQAIAERDKLENEVEAVIEGRITAVAKAEGLTRGFWILPDMLWPPVDMEFTTPPHTLAVSPRDRIELKEATLLRAGLDLGQVIGIERQREVQDNVSALAFPVSGVGAYPTVVTYTPSYREAVEVAAHEWTHNYLAFRPLGIRYYTSNDLRTMNETVADLIGNEIADRVVAEWPLPAEELPAVTQPAPAAPEAPKIDLRAELAKLRGEVDDLLAQGKVEEAERLMEERRQYLAANGHDIRCINQAYFAFVNLYAGAGGSPGATNPIGPKVDELRRLSPSLAAFLKVAGGLTSVADLDRALDEARAP